MDEKVTLEFLSRQIDRVLDRIGTIEDQITVLTGMTMRLDGAVEGLVVETRGMYRLLDRLG
jgi:hypothetical protein